MQKSKKIFKETFFDPEFGNIIKEGDIVSCTFNFEATSGTMQEVKEFVRANKKRIENLMTKHYQFSLTKQRNRGII